MGMPSELWVRSKIQDFFGWIDTFLPGPEENVAASEFSTGQFTDDTNQCIALMDAVIEANGEIVPALTAKYIVRWASKVNAFEKNLLGPSSKLALNSVLDGVEIENIEANSITNGSAMRMAPVGCLLSVDNPNTFVEGVRLACLPTHKSDVAIAGASVVAWSIGRAVGGSGWQDIKSELADLANETQRKYESTFSPLLGHRITLALSVAARSTDLQSALVDIYDYVGTGMNVIESVPAAVALVEAAGTEPMLCAKLAANLGGDTDTIGAMSTAICGALRGINAFPVEHIEFINRQNDVNFVPYAEALVKYHSARGRDEERIAQSGE